MSGSAYDVDAPEGAKSPGSQYLSRKDAKWILGVTAIVIVGLIPVYFSMREKAFKSTCVKNMGAIMEAIDLYASQHDDRLPPVYEAQANGEPQVDDRGYPITWVSEVAPLLSARASFVCPSADPSEYSYSVNMTGGEPIASTYGYYGAYSGHPAKEIDSPENVVLLAETSNGGAKGTFDPLPFENCKYDGFVIGWNNSNEEPTEDTSSVTRLAFAGTSKGDFSLGQPRHGQVIHAITANRGKRNLTSSDAVTRYDRSKYALGGLWRQPITTRN